MGNFGPGWNFVAITWQTSARAEILASAPNMKLGAKSLRRIKMAPRAQIVKIGALIFSQFGLLVALNFQLFGVVTAYKTMNWSQTCLWLHISQLERRICKEREDIFKLAFLTASYCLTLSALKLMFSHSIWALKLERQWIRFSILLP